MIVPAGHSPLGGSSMARAIACPGSVQLTYGIGDGDSDDTFSKPGTAAHALAEICLTQGKDAWEMVGQFVPDDFGVEIDNEMANAVQVYLNWVRKNFPDRNQGNSGVEEFIHCPSIHPYFWMATDFWHCCDTALERVLDIADYKHGAGIIVEAKDNVQGMYYACGVMEQKQLWHKVDKVRITIVQPRGWHPEGSIRVWEISTDDLHEWLERDLIPAMDRALVSRDTVAGQHCRFCPAAGRQCPAILSATEELATMIEKLKLTEDGAASKLTPAQMSRFAALEDMHKIAGKHVNKAIWGALQAGVKVEGRKLVAAKVNRVFKDGAEAAAKKEFGNEAYTERTLKSPAQIEELPGGEAFCARWAMKPEGGLTVASDRDMRKTVNRDMKAGFKPVKRKA